MKTHHIAVSGLKNSGKTVFLATLLNYLRSKGRLGHREIANVGTCVLDLGRARPTGLIRREIKDNNIARLFRLDECVATLKKGEWPAETNAITEFNCDLEFRRKSNPRPRTIRVCFFDYPGEYLGDLPMLYLNYRKWSLYTLERLRDPSLPYQAFFADFLKAEADSSTSYDKLVKLYRDAVLKAYEDWYYFLNPIIGLTQSDGAYCGEENAEFFPTTSNAKCADMAEKHYLQYRGGRLSDFWRRLQKCRRHVFLIDVFGVFQSNKEEVNASRLKDQQALLDEVFGTISRKRTKINWTNPLTYGRLVRGHWTSAIKRMLLVASKADLFPDDEHSSDPVQHRRRLKSYLEQYLDDNWKLLESSLARVTTHAMSAMVCTESRRNAQNGARYVLPARGCVDTETSKRKALPYPFSKEGLPEHMEDALVKQYKTAGLAPPEPTPLGVFPHWKMQAVVTELFSGVV